MSAAPLLSSLSSHQEQRSDSVLSFKGRACTRGEIAEELARLRTQGKCTMCAAKAINCVLLPITIPCCSIVWFCETVNQSSHYTGRDDLPYCESTACKAPCWLPKTQFPQRRLPTTKWEIFRESSLDPCGCCCPCSDEIATRDYLPRDLSERYAELERVSQMAKMLLSPPPQEMVDQGIPRQPIELDQVDLKALLLQRDFKRAAHYPPSRLKSPISLILEYAGPMDEEELVANFHSSPVKPPREIGDFRNRLF